MSAAAQRGGGKGRGRVRRSAAERRAELIEAAAVEFARRGLHGTPVERITRRAGVTQPYAFSLFPSKLALFLAVVEHGFDRVSELFAAAANAAREDPSAGPEELLAAMGVAYKQALVEQRTYLMLQLQSYAACDEEAVRVVVRARYAQLVDLVHRLSGAEEERVDEFFRRGMALNVAAAMGVDDIGAGCSWVRAALGQAAASRPSR